METEIDSPLDNDNFMSFEDWKKKILAKAGQSPENVGQGRSAPAAGNRRRPVNVNDLDSLGEDAEIEIDFGGFVNAESGGHPVGTAREAQDPSVTSESGGDVENKPDPSSFVLGKDAGKTCKERFNYASFDCAATILKTNPQAKSSSSILVENKDSYMLNECSAQNKFFIVELCDDILVDTVVLANYEFFSSMFRHFRVSVSDRYPPAAKTGWKVLGTFEGRNSRDLQPFLVPEPQIWARYLRVEFLTHYGNEFYCPVSLLRVHGTTMFEQFKREQEEVKGDDEFVEQAEEAESETATASSAVMDDVKTNEPVDLPQAVKDRETVSDETRKDESTSESQPSPAEATSSSTLNSEVQQVTEVTRAAHNQSTNSVADVSSSNSSHGVSAAPATAQSSASSSVAVSNKIDDKSTKTEQEKSSSTPTSIANVSTTTSTPTAPSSNQTAVDTASVGHKEKSTSTGSRNDTASTHAGASTNNTQSQPQPQSQQRAPSHTQPHPATPTTQESFFKSVHKRLQQLEANSTLSLQYIEEQSRILRDAFIKVEKRQLAKIETFLVHLNNTAIQELKSYKTMYEQLWQSTVLELDNIKERNQRETSELGARLSIIADELVWQKRMAVIQSTLLLLCLGLVLFVRSGHVGSQLDVPAAQHIGSKYTRIFDTPPGSPEMNGRRRRGISRMWRSETSAASERSGHLSDGINPSDAETDGLRSPVQIEFSPPTPTTAGTFSDAGHGSSPVQASSSNTGCNNDVEKDEQDNGTGDSDEQGEPMQELATQSGPATPRGSRDSRPSWSEVDRAVDVLQAERESQGPDLTLGTKRDKERRQKRSPLRRVESYEGGEEDEEAGDSPGDDSGGDLMFAG